MISCFGGSAFSLVLFNFLFNNFLLIPFWFTLQREIKGRLIKQTTEITEKKPNHFSLGSFTEKLVKNSSKGQTIHPPHSGKQIIG